MAPRWYKRRVAGIVCLLIVVSSYGGCKSREERKRARCERALKKSVGMFTAVGTNFLVKLTDDPAAMKCLKQNPDDPSSCMSTEDAAAYGKKVAEGLEECMAWPDDFVACLERRDYEDPRCEKAYQRIEDLAAPAAQDDPDDLAEEAVPDSEESQGR